MRTCRIILPILLLLAGPAAGAAEELLAEERARMVKTIEAIAKEAGGGQVPRQIAPPVLEALGEVPRHRFVPEDVRDRAYADRPLPIGYGQTISQPYIVALMTHILDMEAGQSVLEVGTGSGYQAAVLAELGAEVATIEIVPELAERAGASLSEAGYEDVAARQGDGYYGWPELAPFDGIVVTAAASHVPPPLIEQLKRGGRMVIPVGPAFMLQHLMLVEKNDEGTVTNTLLLPVRFVPLTGAGTREPG